MFDLDSLLSRRHWQQAFTFSDADIKFEGDICRGNTSTLILVPNISQLLPLQNRRRAKFIVTRTMVVLKTLHKTALSRHVAQSMIRSSSSIHVHPSVLQQRAMSTSSSSSDVASPDVSQWQAKGFMDERRLTLFGTLHEMIDRSCQVFAPNKLFGTYSSETKTFEWMSYQEFANKVDSCRAVLRDLGT